MSLSSIKETAEEVGVDPNVEIRVSTEEKEDVPADPRPTSPHSSALGSSFLECRFDRLLKKKFVDRSEPIFPSTELQLNLEDDQEWREMTEEEESLAVEERSLHKEIEASDNLSIMF